jgi:S-adenosylmethionine synthetase
MKITNKQMKYLRPDAKSQVTIEYNDNNEPVRIDAIVISTQHDDFDAEKKMLDQIKKDVINAKTKQVEQRWVRISGRPNHLWDCECIALAAAMLAGVLPTGDV